MSNHGCGRRCGCMKDEKPKEERCVQVVGVEEKAKKMRLSLQVAADSKPLLAVKRIVEKGNHVVSGPREQDNLILNKNAGGKLMLKPNGRGSYLMKINFVGGGSREITVDSPADESVCVLGSGYSTLDVE
eukprot:2117795-Karenia_brevis.AAC.1